MTFLGTLNRLMIESEQVRVVNRALKLGTHSIRDLPSCERFGDHDSIKGAGVIMLHSKPIACRPCDFALRSPSTSTSAHLRRHAS